jgi:hypothetical protein
MGGRRKPKQQPMRKLEAIHMTRSACMPALAVLMIVPGVGQPRREPYSYFRQYVHLSEAEIRSIEQGQAVAKILPSTDPEQLYVFGAVYVNAEPEAFLKLGMDVERLRTLPQYLAVKKFSEPPKLPDLAGFELDREDLKSLRNCKAGDCDIQLPTEAIEVFRNQIDWSRSDASSRANARFQQMALETLKRYQEGGNDALGAYRDQNKLLNISDSFRALLSRSDTLPAYMPELHRSLLNYPKDAVENSQSIFYWERVDFGLKPTLRINHAVAYRFAGTTGEAHILAVKQLYASHYFQVALDLSVCVRDTGTPQKRGFFLISLKGSRQAGLTGFRGSLLRRIVERKTRSGEQSALKGIKKALER